LCSVANLLQVANTVSPKCSNRFAVAICTS
jgi:hypothetical protein